MQRSLLNDVLDVGRNTLENGGLFDGSFKHFGGYWFSVTLWCTFGCGFIYLGCGLAAVIINKKYTRPSFALVPAFTALYGVIVGFIIGGLAGIAIAAMYDTGPFEMHWSIAAVWGLGLSAFHFITSFARGILR